MLYVHYYYYFSYRILILKFVLRITKYALESTRYAGELREQNLTHCGILCLLCQNSLLCWLQSLTGVLDCLLEIQEEVCLCMLDFSEI